MIRQPVGRGVVRPRGCLPVRRSATHWVCDDRRVYEQAGPADEGRHDRSAVGRWSWRLEHRSTPDQLRPVGTGAPSRRTWTIQPTMVTVRSAYPTPASGPVLSIAPPPRKIRACAANGMAAVAPTMRTHRGAHGARA